MYVMCLRHDGVFFILNSPSMVSQCFGGVRVRVVKLFPNFVIHVFSGWCYAVGCISGCHGPRGGQRPDRRYGSGRHPVAHGDCGANKGPRVS